LEESDFAGLAAECGKVEEGATGLQVDEEIYIAVGRCFTAGDGPKGAHVIDAVPLGGVE